MLTEEIETPTNVELDEVEQYARDVVEGREVAGPEVRAACARHLRDLVEGPARGIRWDYPAAQRVFDFFEQVLRLAGGKSEGKPFVLAPPQKFIVGSLFGWKDPDGSRRFRVAFIEMGKGNGKSPLAAGIGLYMLVADGEPRAEVYSAAVDQSQAKVLFRDAVAMVDQSTALSTRIKKSGAQGNEWNLAFHATGSFFRPIASEHKKAAGKSGPRPHCVLIDEVHEHPSNKMVEFMRAGTKDRRQALIFLITNSGVFDTESVAWNYHQRAVRIAGGQEEDDSFFAYVCSLDKHDDWKDPAVWKKANPLLGVSIGERYIREQVREAKGLPSKQSIVRRLNCCEWVGADDPFVEPEVWDQNGAKIPAELLRGRACFGGLDLSSINDLAALVLVFLLDDGRKAVLPFFWKATDVLIEHGDRDGAPYQQWAEDGWLLTNPGKTIRYPFICAKLAEIAAQYDLRGVAFDPWKIDDLIQDGEGIGAEIPFVKHGQGYSGGEITMSFSILKLETDLKDGILAHGNHPVLNWCIANAKVLSDPAENRKFDKRNSTGRIDGAVALAMANGLCDRESGRENTVSGEVLYF